MTAWGRELPATSCRPSKRRKLAARSSSTVRRKAPVLNARVLRRSQLGRATVALLASLTTLVHVGSMGEARPSAVAAAIDEATPAAIEQLVRLLRGSPDDSELLARVVDWSLERDALEAVTARLAPPDEADSARETPPRTAAERAIDFHLIARLREEAGQPALAFDAYEHALATGHSLAASRRTFTSLLLRGGWAERAREVWGSGVPDAPPNEVAEIEFRLRHALDGESAAERYLRDEADFVTAETRAVWAGSAGLTALATELWQIGGQPRAAFECALAGGDARRAEKIWREHGFAMDDAQALSLARVLGDAKVLEDHLGDRDDDVAARLRAQLAMSLGSAGAGRPSEPERTTGGGPDVVDGAARRTAEGDGVGRREGVDGRDPLLPDPSMRAATARGIIASAAANPQERAVLSTSGEPRLEVVLAWLVLGEEEPARKEWTRWTLAGSDDPSSALVQRVRARVPHWFAGAELGDDLAADALRRLETVPAPTPSSAGDVASAMERTIQRALTRAEAGSAIEAQLLYHRGRVLGRDDDLERALAIAPNEWVTEPRGSVRTRTTIAMAVARLRGVEDVGGGPSEIQIPEPIDAAIAILDGRVASLGAYPFGVAEHLGTWTLDEWEPASTAIADLAGLTWNPEGAVLPNGERWVAGGIAPVHSVIRLPGAGWVLVGSGLVVLGETAPFERVRLESDARLTATALPPDVTSALSPALALFLGGLEVARVPGWKEADRFLDGIRTWRGDAAVEWAGALGSGERLLVRTTTGERVWLTRERKTPTTPRFFGYERGEDGCLRRLGADTPPPLWPTLREETPREPPSPPVHHGPFELAWQRSAALPQQASPFVEPTGPEPPFQRKLPAALEAETIVAGAGDDPAVRVTSGGHVLYYNGDSGYPLWIRTIATPLPGPHGFPPPPVPPRRTEAPDRGPHRVGPTADARTPRVFLERDGFFVMTDRINAFDWRGRMWTLELDGADADAIEIRDVCGPPPAVAAPDSAIEPSFANYRILLGNRTSTDGSLARMETSAADDCTLTVVALPGVQNAFDLATVGERDYLLGVRHGEFALWEVHRGATVEHPLPTLTLEGDRAGLRITTLGCTKPPLAHWAEDAVEETTLWLLHESLYRGRIVASPADDTSVMIEWEQVLSWPEHDPWRQPFYLQTPPSQSATGALIIGRPWGVVECWRPVP